MNRRVRDRKKPTPAIAIEPLLLNIKGVCAITGLSEAAIRRAMRDGAFPQSRHLCGAVVWDVAAIRQWVNQ